MNEILFEERLGELEARMETVATTSSSSSSGVSNETASAPSYEKERRFYVISSIIFIYGSTFLVIVGLFGNIVSLLVFFRAKKKTPKIAARKFLILLTISNTVYLFLSWYVKTVPLIVIQYGQSHHVDTYGQFYFIENVRYNRYTCKLVNYLTAAMRFLSVLLTLSFSIERAIAVCFPLKMMVYKQRMAKMSSRLLAGLACFAFTTTLYFLSVYDLKEEEVDPGRIESFCTSSHTDFFPISFILVTMGLPVVVIIISNIAIVVTLKRNQSNFECSLVYTRRPTSMSARFRSDSTCEDVVSTFPGGESSRGGAGESVVDFTRKPRLSADLKCVLVDESSLDADAESGPLKSMTELFRVKQPNYKLLYNGARNNQDVHFYNLHHALRDEAQALLPQELFTSSSASTPSGKRDRTVTIQFKNKELSRLVNPSLSSTSDSVSSSASFSSLSLPLSSLSGVGPDYSKVNFIIVRSECADGGGGYLTLYENTRARRSVMVQPAALLPNAVSTGLYSKTKKNYQKVYNTKMLIAITTLYVLMNMPYFLLSFLILIFSLQSLENFSNTMMSTPAAYSSSTSSALSSLFVASTASPSSTTSAETLPRLSTHPSTYVWHAYLILSELLYVSNYSLFMLFLLISGRIYRHHLKSVLKSCLLGFCEKFF